MAHGAERESGHLTNLALMRSERRRLDALGNGIPVKFYMDKLKRATDADVTHLVKRSVDLAGPTAGGLLWRCDRIVGAGDPFARQYLCRKVHTALMEYAPDSVGFYWRGVGRSVYFSPLNFLPGFVHPCRAIKMCEDEAPNLEMKETMLAGVAWALTVVNMVTPEVMEWALANHDDYFSGSPGFFNGVTSAVVMRHDTTLDDPLVPQFMNHKPSEEPTLCGLWNSKIKGSKQRRHRYPFSRRPNTWTRYSNINRYRPWRRGSKKVDRCKDTPPRVRGAQCCRLDGGRCRGCRRGSYRGTWQPVSHRRRRPNRAGRSNTCRRP